jgi:2',3'-cyclic-nucleotide 2'-phosphodiesterase (5'-nucleotidase family)
MADTIVTSTMTGAQILDILNNDGSDIEENGTVGEGRYYVASGLTVQFDPWASGSDRVISCKTADGKEIDAEATYQVAYFYGSLPEGSQSPETSLNQTWQESFLEWLDQQGGVIKAPTMTIELSYGEAK